MFHMFKYADYWKTLTRQIEQQIAPRVAEIEQLIDENQARVLRAFQQHEVSDFHFAPSTGYGYDDSGRETLEKIYATVFGAEAALVRPQIISGTHAISNCLFGLLRPGDKLLYITGRPYDTLLQVIGEEGNGRGSLKEFGIAYQEVPLTSAGKVNMEMTLRLLSTDSTIKVAAIQRSRGYAGRPSLPIADMARIIEQIKLTRPDVYIFVDNCYGEFTEPQEPTHVGADIIAGSLIKNPGGGLAKTGGYIVGKRELVEQASYRMAAPGIGGEGGATLGTLLDMYQGFFLAPHVVGEALKGAVFTSAILERLGFRTNPSWDDARTDLIQAVDFAQAEQLITFCQAIQHASPVDAHVTPQPDRMPGYEDPVIMAAGTFVQGASIELTADGPIREPYRAYVQGGLTYSHVKIAILQALDSLAQKELITLDLAVE